MRRPSKRPYIAGIVVGCCLLSLSHGLAAQSTGVDSDDISHSPDYLHTTELMHAHRFVEAITELQSLRTRTDDLRVPIRIAEANVALQHWAHAYEAYHDALEHIALSQSGRERRVSTWMPTRAQIETLSAALRAVSRQVGFVELDSSNMPYGASSVLTLTSEDADHFATGADDSSPQYAIDANRPIDLTLRCPGYEAEVLSVTVAPGQTHSMSYAYRPLVGWMSLSIAPSNVFATVTIDSQAVGRPIVDYPLVPGSHRVEISAAGYVARMGTVQVSRGEHARLTVTLVPVPPQAEQQPNIVILNAVPVGVDPAAATFVTETFRRALEQLGYRPVPAATELQAASRLSLPSYVYPDGMLGLMHYLSVPLGVHCELGGSAGYYRAMIRVRFASEPTERTRLVTATQTTLADALGATLASLLGAVVSAPIAAPQQQQSYAPRCNPLGTPCSGAPCCGMLRCDNGQCIYRLRGDVCATNADCYPIYHCIAGACR